MAAGAVTPHHDHDHGRGGIGRLWSRLADAQSWRALPHAVVALPLAAEIASTTLAGALLLVTLALVLRVLVAPGRGSPVPC